MIRRVFCLVALAIMLVSPARSASVSYGTPAGSLPAGRLHGETFQAVLPSGRITRPLGMNVVTGMNALGVALSPDGRFAIVSNDDERESFVHSLLDPRTQGGYSLAVVDTATMQVVDRYRAADEKFYAGVVTLRDPRDVTNTLVLASGGAANAVYAFDLDSYGRLRRDAAHVIATPRALDPAFADLRQSFPATMTLSDDARRAYVVNALSGTVSTIDTATRSLVGSARPAGYFPSGIAISGDRLIVANEGLMRYGFERAPLMTPPFLTTPADPERASSLTFLSTNDFATAALQPPLPLDPVPDGLRVVGGAHPSAVVATPNGAYAFVAVTNVDRIATVDLAASRVVGGTELRLFDRGPYGTQPDALALSRDGSRLYVALAGLNAIAVIDARDPIHLHRLGLIPTGWYPSALALSSDDRTLYVTNAKGFGHDAGFSGDSANDADANAVWSTLQRIDLGPVKLAASTRTTLANTRRIVATPSYPRGITNVVVILEEDKTFDSMLGDLGYGPADPAFVQFGESVTPNLHALARRYAVAGNLFADAEESNAAHQFFAGGIATAYTEKTLPQSDARTIVGNANQNPEDYPRVGYIFHNLARHGIAFRDYGDLVRVSGYDTDNSAAAASDDGNALTQGLGGSYSLDVPAPAILAGHIDLNYPGWNPRIRDVRRAKEFTRDYDTLVRAGRQPRYTSIWLPADSGGAGANLPAPAEQVADGDRALGTIVQYLSSLPSWKNTAVFVMPDDAQRTRDHVDEYRTYAVVISPYAKQHFVGMRHLSTVSVLKSSEQILGLPPLALGDVLATDMSDFFTAHADVRPYHALPVATQPESGR